MLDIVESDGGKPTDNAFVESFNATFRSECLNTHWFMNLKEAWQLIEAWKREYDESSSRTYRRQDAK